MKPIFYYSVMTGNRGDIAIREAITSRIKEKMDISFAFFNVKYEELTEQRILNQLNTEASGLMIAGSGLYTNYNMSSGWYFPCKTELFDKIKVPIFLLGLGCNNNLKNDIFDGELKEDTKKSIKKINELACISTVRDLRTYNKLSEIGINSHHLLPDPACFLRSPKKPRRKRVAINLAQHAPVLGRFDGNKEFRNKNIKFFNSIINYLFSNKYEVVLINHDALEYSIYEDLKKCNPDLELVDTDNINEMLNAYAECQFSIGEKMHSNILSFATETPFISLYYDVKSIEFLKLIKKDDLGRSVFDLDFHWTIEKINFLINYGHHIQKQIVHIKNQKEIVWDNVLDLLCNILKNTN